MKRGTIQHPKLRQLAILLKAAQYVVVGILESIWHFTAEYTPDGAIGKYTDEYIASWIGYPDDAKTLIKALLKAGWLEKSREHRLIVHDWSEHCDDSVKMKLFRARKTFSDGKVPNPSRMSLEERQRISKEIEDSRVHGVPQNAPACTPPIHSTPLHSQALPSPLHPTNGPKRNGDGVLTSSASDGLAGRMGEMTAPVLKANLLKDIPMNPDDKERFIHREDITPARLNQEIIRLRMNPRINDIAAVLITELLRGGKR